MKKYDPEGKCVELLPVLKSSTFSDWLSRLKRIKSEGLMPASWDSAPVDYGDLLLNFMLSTNYSEQIFFSDQPTLGDYNFPCTSEEMWAVVILQVAPENSFFVIDATDLIHSGWTKSFENFIEHHQAHTTFYSIFKASLVKTSELSKIAPESAALARLLFANTITVMETYLSDTMRKEILGRNAVLRNSLNTMTNLKIRRKIQ